MKLPNIRIRKTVGEKLAKKTEPGIGTFMRDKFDALKDAGNVALEKVRPAREAKQDAAEEGCGNPDCPVHGKNKDKMPSAEQLEKMKEIMQNVRIANVENESCFCVTDGEHFFKVYEARDVQPVLEAFCAARGLDKEKFTITHNEDKDFRGAMAMLRENKVKLLLDDGAVDLKVLMIRNEEGGFTIVLDKKAYGE